MDVFPRWPSRDSMDSGGEEFKLVGQRNKRRYGDRHSKPSTGSDEESQRPKARKNEYAVILKLKSTAAKSINPMHLAECLAKEIGSFQHAKSLANGRILVVCQCKLQQERALAITTLQKCDVEVYVPGTGLRPKGVVYGVPTEIADEEILLNAKGAKILKVKRFQINKDNKKVASQTVLLTFDAEVIPRREDHNYEECGSALCCPNLSCAFCIPQLNVKCGHRISDYMSVFTAESLGILKALQWVAEAQARNVVICSDSSSVLHCLKANSSNAHPDLISDILLLLYNLHKSGCEVSFLWVPAHIGLKGNELADECAKERLRDDAISLLVSPGRTELRSKLMQEVFRIWQLQWDRDAKGRQLYSIQLSVSSQCTLSGYRSQQIVISRLRLGH
ncbi:hypothetical protein ACEWY4_003888 [Coilia grayii]|uniref:RNase H type-1 domain-containing protein n=1 Tax=Coilia grayii TaxID=363190 RepID=A0ABD1KJY5_9TELE